MKKLYFIPIGGLANRLFSMNSAISFCEDYNIKLKIIWFKDKGMGAGFSDLFLLSSQYNNVEIVDAKWYHYIFDRPRKRNLWLPYLFQYFYFCTKIYEYQLRYLRGKELYEKILEKRKTYLIHWAEFYSREVMKYDRFLLNREIQGVVNKRVSVFRDIPTVGVHVRRSDNVNSINNSPISLFIERIKREIADDNTVQFYVASDSLEEKQKLIKMFGRRVITSTQEVRRDTTDGIIEAVIDLYALAKTQKIYGSFYSTFSSYAAKINAIPLEILTVTNE